MKLPLLAAALLLAAPCRAFWFWLGERTESRWLDKPLLVDGHGDAWQARDGDDAEGIVYGFANDGKDLYMLFAPHTQSTKEQLAGLYQQDVTLWFDAQGGVARKLALRIRPPFGGDIGARAFESVGFDTATLDAEAVMGAIDERGVLEARIALSNLGTPLPPRISVGLETTKPLRPPRRGPVRVERPGGKRQGGGAGDGGGSGGAGGTSGDEESLVTNLWIRVTLAKPAPKAKP